MMIKKGKFFENKLIDFENQLADLEVLFHNLDGIEQGVMQLDTQGKGFVECDELLELVQEKL